VQFLASLAATTCGLVFVVSGLDHVGRPRALSDALATHGFESNGLRVALATMIGLVEASLGLVGLFAVILQAPILEVTLFAIASLYGIYALYATWLVRRRPWAPCGCSSRQHVINIWVPIRAAALGAGSLVAAIAVEQVYAPSSSAQHVTVATAGVAWAALLWTLPEAMADSPPRVQPA